MGLVQSTLSKLHVSAAESPGDSWFKKRLMFKINGNGLHGQTLIQSTTGGRLRDQVFAYTVTDQVINFGEEVIYPRITDAVAKIKTRVAAFMAGKPMERRRTRRTLSTISSSTLLIDPVEASVQSPKGWGFETEELMDSPVSGEFDWDDVDYVCQEDFEVLNAIEAEAAMPEYELFGELRLSVFAINSLVSDMGLAC